MNITASVSALMLVTTMTSAAAQVCVDVDMREGPNGVLAPVTPLPTSTVEVFNCLSIGLPFGVGSVRLNFGPNSDFNVNLEVELTDTPGEVVNAVCGFFPVCPSLPIDYCGPQIVERLDYGVLRGGLNVYSAAAGGGFSGGASYTRIAEGRISWNEMISVYSPIATTIRMPLTVEGSVLGSESFGDPTGTYARAELSLSGTALGQPISKSVAVESISVIPETANIAETVDAVISIPAGTTLVPVNLTGVARVEARAQSAGLFGTLVGAATAGASFPNSIRIGRIQGVGGNPLPAGFTATGMTSGILYEGCSGVGANFCTSPINSSGNSAAIGILGSTSIGQNDLQLEVDGVPANTFGLFVYGSGQEQMPLGDGFVCVGPSPFRLTGPLAANAQGGILYPVNLTLPQTSTGAGRISSLTAWSFQFWFRDVGQPGGTGFSLTNGVAVMFCP